MSALNVSELLINQAKSGDSRALTRLMFLYKDAVYFYIKSRVKNQADVQDILIMSFTKAFLKLHTYKHESPFKPWLFAITKNTLIDFFRANKSQDYTFLDSQTEAVLYLELQDQQDSPELVLISQERLEQIKKIIYQMPEPYREIIELRYMEQLSNDEIAQQLNIAVNNVKVRLVRARRKLWAQIIKLES